MARLKKHDLIPLEFGGEAEVIDLINPGGGQGEVYKVLYCQKEYALKWYFSEKIHNPEKFKDSLRYNINYGSPSSIFIWPQFLTQDFRGSFGYLMDIKPKRFIDFEKFLLADETHVYFSGHLAVATAALNIINAFRDLHREGFSYQDLNPGNFAIDPKTGDVCILDNDNVSQFGEFSGIAGRTRYMAPEIVCGNALPDDMTDRFSLAVVLFCMLFLSYPLEGAATTIPCMKPDFETYFYGTNPVFCLDPTISTNRPVRGVHTNLINLWPTYPKYIQDLFVKAFNQNAIKDPNKRVLEIEWQKAFVTLRDSIVKCKCGTYNILEPGQTEWKCKNTRCGLEYKDFKWLEFNGYNIPLTNGKAIYQCHLTSGKDDIRIIEGKIAVAPNGKLGIVNTNPEGKPWVITLKDGAETTTTFNQGMFIDLIETIKINDKIGKIK